MVWGVFVLILIFVFVLDWCYKNIKFGDRQDGDAEANGIQQLRQIEVDNKLNDANDVSVRSSFVQFLTVYYTCTALQRKPASRAVIF